MGWGTPQSDNIMSADVKRNTGFKVIKFGQILGFTLAY